MHELTDVLANVFIRNMSILGQFYRFFAIVVSSRLRCHFHFHLSNKKKNNLVFLVLYHKLVTKVVTENYS